jgi:hypothetical protein
MDAAAKFGAGDNNMANANRQSSMQNSIPGAAIIAAGAGTLILLGIVLQVCELGYGHSGLGGAWLFSVLASGIWNILVLQMNVPWVQELLRFWPLVLVGTGFAVLLLGKLGGQPVTPPGSRAGDRNGS